MNKSSEPPSGWYPFGMHAGWDTGDIPPLEFSKEVGEDGMPLWERLLWKHPKEIVKYLVETDALSPTDSETLHPQSYVVETENLEYLVKTVLEIAGRKP